MKTLRGLCLCIVSLAVVGIGPVESAPRDTWDLEFTFQDPARITLTLPGESGPAIYWYMVYTATNNTGQDVGFFPSFELVTDQLTVTIGNEAISPTVVKAIRDLLHKRYPFLVDPMKVSGPLLQGTDNARTSVVVFRDFDPRASEFTVFVGGLSNQIEQRRNPAFDPEKPEGGSNSRFFLLRKTLAITYDLPGDEDTRVSAIPRRGEMGWVMR